MPSTRARPITITTTNTTPQQPPTTPSTPPLPIDGPRIVNIVSGANLNCRLDLPTIARHVRNAEYKPKRFQAVMLRQRDPKSCALVFASGKLQVLGTRAIADAHLAARKFARIIQKLGFHVRLTGFNVQNLVAHVDLKFPLRLEGLHTSRHMEFVSYEPEIFPALVYRMLLPKVSLLVFTSGKVVMLGAKKEEELAEGMRKLFPVLQEFRLQRAEGDARPMPR